MKTGIASLDRALAKQAWVPAMRAIIAEVQRRAAAAGDEPPEDIEAPLHEAIEVVARQLVAAKTVAGDAALLDGVAQPQIAEQLVRAIKGIAWKPGSPGVYVPGSAASPGVLRAIAERARPGDPLAKDGFACLAILEGANAPAACAALIDRAPRGARTELARAVLSGQSVFSADPAWIDVVAPALTSAAPPTLWSMLYRFASPAIIARCLAHPCSPEVVTEILKLARRMALPGQGALLAAAAAAPHWKGTADGKRIAALAKALGLAPAPGIGYVEREFVGTEGGPVVVMATSKASAWRGTETTDYDDASSILEVGFLPNRDQPVLVLPALGGCSVGRATDGAPLWFVLAGLRALDSSGRSLSWKRVDRSIVVDRRGLVACDAAFAGDGNRRRPLEIAPGSYRVEVAHTDDEYGEIWVARLVGVASPKARAKSPPKKSPGRTRKRR